MTTTDMTSSDKKYHCKICDYSESGEFMFKCHLISEYHKKMCEEEIRTLMHFRVIVDDDDAIKNVEIFYKEFMLGVVDYKEFSNLDDDEKLRVINEMTVDAVKLRGSPIWCIQ